MSQHPLVCTDFDFEFGKWTVAHRRLKRRLCGCDEWEEFTGTSEARPIFGGNGNFEENRIELPSGPYLAVALRGYDAAKGTWAIWWLDERNPNYLDPPVIGRFQNGVGTFMAKDTFEGRPILVRFLWLDVDKVQPRWEQAFSSDDGASWETNWTMRFARAAG